MKWENLQSLVPNAGDAPDYKACLDAFPVLEKAKTTPQGRYHLEGDVWIHTRMVVDALLQLDDYRHATRHEQEILFLAALLHDVSKYRTTVVDPVTGDIGQPGHSRKGAIEARELLWDFGVPFDTREAICRLIANHQVPFFALEGKRGQSPEYVVRELSWQLSIPLLAALAEADMRGRICDVQQQVLDAIDLFRELARDEGCYGRPRAFADAHTRVAYFRGANVHPDYALFHTPGSDVVVLSGLPASGKDTWVAENGQGRTVLAIDDAHDELGLRHGQNPGKAVHLVIDRARELLRRKEPFIWNATHISQLMRDKTLGLLYDYGAQVHLVYLEQSRAELLRRNHRRDTSLTNKALQGMTGRWEVPTPVEADRVTYTVGE